MRYWCQIIGDGLKGGGWEVVDNKWVLNTQSR